MEPQIIDYYNEMPSGINVIEKMNEEFSDLQKENDELKKENGEIQEKLFNIRRKWIYDSLMKILHEFEHVEEKWETLQCWNIKNKLNQSGSFDDVVKLELFDESSHLKTNFGG